MYLFCLALLGPILYLGTVPAYLAAIPVVIAGLLAGLNATHSVVERTVKQQQAQVHAPPEDMPEAPELPEANSAASAPSANPTREVPLSASDIATREKLIKAGLLAPVEDTVVVTGQVAHAAPAGVIGPIQLDAPPAYAVVAEQVSTQYVHSASTDPVVGAPDPTPSAVFIEPTGVSVSMDAAIPMAHESIVTCFDGPNDDWASIPAV